MWNLPKAHICYQFLCLKFHNCEHPRAPVDDIFDHDDIEMFNQNSNLRKKKGNSSSNKKTEAEETNGRVRKVTVEYRNAGETVNRKTVRVTRGLAVLHKEEDLDWLQQLNEAAKRAQIHFNMIQQTSEKQI